MTSSTRRFPAPARTLALGSLLFLAVFGCGDAAAEPDAPDTTAATASSSGEVAKAVFAGGCFWCMEPPYDELDGVLATISGYIGGKSQNPTYEAVSAGRTGHTEAVEVTYDPAVISYEELLDVFWVNVDPTVNDRQFCDRGSQYRPGIFYADPAERQAAEDSKAEIERTKTFPQPIVVEITQATTFFPAEEYHQDYYKKNPLRYKLYRTGCGRDARLRELWGDAAGK